MSKSRGNIVRTETILDAFGTLYTPPPVLAQNDVILSEAQSAKSKDPEGLGTGTAAQTLPPQNSVPATKPNKTSSPPTSYATSSSAKSPSARTAASASTP